MSCTTFSELGYGEFARRLAARVRGRRVPLMGSFELTFRCNLRCKHCYLDGKHDGVPGLQELTLDEIREILDQIADSGCLWLLLTGGEPLVRADFLDIYLSAKRKGFLLSLFTNGTLLTPEIADVLSEWPPFVVEITLYGHTQETYERVTGVPGSHARCLRGIELLLERGIPLRLKTMVLTLNKHELWDMQAYAENLGVDFRYDAQVNPGIDGNRQPLAYRLAPREVVEMELEDEVRLERLRQRYRQLTGRGTDSQKLYQCGAGDIGFHINPYGNLGICTRERVNRYDLRSCGFQEGWDALGLIRSLEYGNDNGCADCELRALCSPCPAWASLEHGDSDRYVSYLCELAGLRADRLWSVDKNQPSGSL